MGRGLEEESIHLLVFGLLARDIRSYDAEGREAGRLGEQDRHAQWNIESILQGGKQKYKRQENWGKKRPRERGEREREEG